MSLRHQTPPREVKQRKPYKPRKRRADRYRGPCHCNDHVWAVLTKGYVTFVDLEDDGHLQAHNWYAQVAKRNRVIYAAARGRGNKFLRLHREIIGESASVSADIDHRDHNGLNNRRANLRLCSRVQNSGNGRYRLGASGYRGVWSKESGRWRAYLAGRHLGTFNTAEEAARAYDAAAIKRFGESFVSLNFPPPVPADREGPR